MPFATPGQVFVTEGKEYEVQAMCTAATEGIALVQVADDLGYSSWLPIWLFDVRDQTLPEDWTCNFFREADYVVLGPDFITRDEASYNEMVEQVPEQTDRFWSRIRAREGGDEGSCE
ncbi:MAG: hypothetical protein ACFCGT_13195 [Sandaracinaceae bacterium]